MDLTQRIRVWLRKPVNQLLSPLGVRLVSRDWGPRGQMASLAKLEARGARPSVIVDAGASDGMWTRQVREVFPKAEVLMVDPLPENAAALEALTRKDRRCRCFHGALGGESARRELIVHGDQSSFYASELFAGPKLVIDQVRLDDLLEGELLPHPPDLIKADVQGAELEILRGAKRCLEHARWLLLEVSFERIYSEAPLAHEVIREASEHGFCIRDICALLQGADGGLLQADLLFEKEGAT